MKVFISALFLIVSAGSIFAQKSTFVIDIHQDTLHVKVTAPFVSEAPSTTGLRTSTSLQTLTGITLYASAPRQIWLCLPLPGKKVVWERFTLHKGENALTLQFHPSTGDMGFWHVDRQIL